jgi:outer membrane protein assembly factor BamD (BamD/ComL family)
MKPQWLDDLKNAVAELEAETGKFYEKGNKSAGTRSRKLLQDIKALSQTGRAHIQAAKSETPSA